MTKRGNNEPALAEAIFGEWYWIGGSNPFAASAGEEGRGGGEKRTAAVGDGFLLSMCVTFARLIASYLQSVHLGNYLSEIYVWLAIYLPRASRKHFLL